MNDSNFSSKKPSAAVPARDGWLTETSSLHDAIDAAGVGRLNPHTPTIVSDMQGSEFVTAWQEAKGEAHFTLERCWSELPPLYGRYGTSATKQVIAHVKELECAKAAVVTDCGMQAIALLIDVLIEPGDEAVLLRQVYNKTKNYLTRVCERIGATLTIVDDDDYQALAAAITDKTKLLLAETFTNPLLYAQDITRLVALKEKAPQLHIAIDSTIATPWAFKTPLLAQGVCSVVASGTKSLGGHDADLWGYCATNDIGLANQLMDLVAMRGGILDWRRAQAILDNQDAAAENHQKRVASAEKVAAFLNAHEKVEAVFHPSVATGPQRDVVLRDYAFGSGMLSFRLADATEDEVKHFCDVLAMTECVRYATSFDGLVSKINHHKSVSEYFTPNKTLQRQGIDRLARFACGIEAPQDIIAALNWALWYHGEVTSSEVTAWRTRRNAR